MPDQARNQGDYYDTFTFTCDTCGATVPVVDGVVLHGCPPGPAVEISGCSPSQEVSDGRA